MATVEWSYTITLDGKDINVDKYSFMTDEERAALLRHIREQQNKKPETD